MADATLKIGADLTEARQARDAYLRETSQRGGSVPLVAGGGFAGTGFASGAVQAPGLTYASGAPAFPQTIAPTMGGIGASAVGGAAGNASVQAAAQQFAAAAVTAVRGAAGQGAASLVGGPGVAGGTSRGFLSPGTVAYGAASRFIGPAAIATGLIELSHIQSGQQRAEFEGVSASSYDSYVQSQIAGVRNLNSGPIGSLYGLYRDNFTTGGPADTIERLEYGARSQQYNREAGRYNREVGLSAAERYAYRTGGTSGQRRQAIANRAVDAQDDIDDQIGEQRDLQSRVVVGRSAADNREFDLRERRIELLRGRREQVGVRRDFELGQFDDERYLDRQSLAARGGDARDVGQSDVEQARRALSRRQAVEYSHRRRTDRASLPTLEADQDAETDRFEREVLRSDRFADFGNASAARQARYRGANNPFGASLSGILDRGAVDTARAPQSQRPGIQDRVQAEVGALVSETARSFAAQQLQLGTQQSVLARQLARDPLGAQLEAIRGATNAQILGADSLPFGVRQATQYGLRQVGRAQQDLARQRYGDQVLETRAALEFGNESLRIQTANGDGSSYGERARRAETNDIVRQTQLAQLRAVNEGRLDLLPGYRERGRLQLQDQSQRYLDSFQAAEGDARRLAGGTGSAQRVLDDIAKAAGQLNNPANPGGADKPITGTELKSIINEAIDRLDKTR